MTRLDKFLLYAESHRLAVCCIAGLMIVLIAWADWVVPGTSLGFLYLLPVLVCAPALNSYQIPIMAIVCGYLREAFDPLQIARGAAVLPVAMDPRNWVAGSIPRLIVAVSGFAATGFLVTELNGRKRLLAEQIREREEGMRQRRENEFQVRMLLETSPLAILTLDDSGRIALANESARQLLGFDDEPLPGREVEPYLPILNRMLHRHHPGNNIRTSVECRGVRRNGEVFLAHVWLSTYQTSAGQGLAAVVWDASENLRDREGAGLDSMMATSRILIGAISHEIRNLASAAGTAYGALAAGHELAGDQNFQALGSLIQGLEKIASSGLRMAANREAVVADLGTVLDETRVVIEPALREADIRMVWEIGQGLPRVQADHHSLLQAFVNLARNSLRAMEHATRRELRVVASVERDLVVVRFHDTGPGVAHPEELFRPFQPGAHSHGLGLYISRAILGSHGGGLRYEPEETGSCFVVELWPVENIVDG